MSQFRSITQVLNNLDISKELEQEKIQEENNAITTPIEQISKALRLSLAGKCFISIFPADFLIKTFNDVVVCKNVKSKALLYLSKLNKQKSYLTKEDWRKYYILLEQHSIPKGRRNYIKEDWEK